MSKPRLLLVEDHHDTLRLFQTYLSMAGFTVVPVDNAVAALRLPVHRFDAICTDIAMPGMDGISFVRELRETRCRARIPIVAVTGQGRETAEASRRAGCCGLFVKPCALDELAEALHRLVRTCGHDCARCQNRLPSFPGPDRQLET